jgi:quercetin dioxygenase-like cupin family protein
LLKVPAKFTTRFEIHGLTGVNTMTYAIYTEQEAVEKRIDEDWGSLTWLASQGIGNARGLTLGRVMIRPGHSNPRHCHTNCEEALYLLRGRLEHSVADETIVLSAGDVLTVPAGVMHHATNIGDDDADMIVSYSSGLRDFELET